MFLKGLSIHIKILSCCHFVWFLSKDSCLVDVYGVKTQLLRCSCPALSKKPQWTWRWGRIQGGPGASSGRGSTPSWGRLFWWWGTAAHVLAESAAGNPPEGRAAVFFKGQSERQESSPLPAPWWSRLLNYNWPTRKCDSHQPQASDVGGRAWGRVHRWEVRDISMLRQSFTIKIML